MESGFKLLPKRWIVEKTFAWFGRSRRLSKEYEGSIEVSQSFVYLAMCKLMCGRILIKGLQTAFSFIGDINNFKDEKKLAAYFGLVTRVNNSNETVNHGRIIQRGLGKDIVAAVRKLLTIVYYPFLNNSWYFKGFVKTFMKSGV
jgi:hypothetical protein